MAARKPKYCRCYVVLINYILYNKVGNIAIPPPTVKES